MGTMRAGIMTRIRKLVYAFLVLVWWSLVLIAGAHAQVPIVGSTGSFQSVFVNSVPTIPLPNQGSYTGWNHAGLGESDFFTAPGSGTGGFCWYNTVSATSVLMCLSSIGQLTTTSVAAGNMLINGNNSLVSAQGLNLGWNESGGSGESDFVNQFQAGGVGGFNWYNTGTSGNHGSPIMTLSQTGPTLTVNNFAGNLTGNGAGTWTGPLVGNGAGTWTGPVVGNASSATVAASTSGNAATATQLAAAPSNCSGVPSTGIQQNGTANCFPSTYKVQSMIITSGICTTADGAGASCSFTSPDWPAAFADTSYSISCTMAPPTGSGSAPGLTLYTGGKTTTFFAVTLQGGQGNSGGTNTTAEIDCTGTHN